jgi:hypothetical protein
MDLAGPSSRGLGQVVLSHQTGVRIPVALLASRARIPPVFLMSAPFPSAKQEGMIVSQ